MQKVGLTLGLIVAVGAAVYAYPGGDKRNGPVVKLTTEAGERDGPAPTALDKLKAATRGETVTAKPTTTPAPAAEVQATLPAPRVMDAVRQELSARPSAPAVAAPAPTASPVVLGNRAATSNAASPVDEKAVEKLASRLAAEATGPAAAAKPATTLQPASISLTNAPTTAPAAETSDQAAAAATDATAAQQQPARKKAAAARVERRKSGGSDNPSAKNDRRSPMSGIARSGYAPNTVTRFDGL